VLGVVGLYGVIAYTVSQRAREISVRMALGAQRRSVYWLVMGDAGRLVSLGPALGVVVAVALGTLMQHLLFAVEAEEELLAGETRTVILQAIDALPPAQREVIVLRDIEGLPSTAICNILGVTDTHQRVLLHRARSRVRHALERYFAGTEPT
jgi:RNA polymerase sigma factor (sigma-70 family)